MVTAQSTDRRVEDVSQRDEFTQVFANPDGTWTAETASEHVRTQDEKGVWHDIDTTLVPRNGGLAPAYAVTDVVLSDGGDSTFASIATGAREIAWRWPGPLPEPTVEGDTATYRNALQGSDLVVTATATGFTHSLVLHEAPSKPVRITIPVVTGGARLVETPQGGLKIASKAGKTLVSAPQPLMWDSSENAAGESENVAPVETVVGETRNGTPTFTLLPREEFFSDPDTVYPVVVDPSFTTYTNGDVWVQNADYTSGQTSSPELRAGTYDGGGHVARSFMHFDTTKWNNKQIQSATLVLRNFYSGSCTGAAIEAKRITSEWNGNTMTWANKPGGGDAFMDTFSPAHGYTSSCGAGNATWNIKGMVQDWADGDFANNGIMLRASNESSIYTWRKYRSANYQTSPSFRPKINVTYNSYPDTAEKPTISTPSASNPGYSTSLTPTLKAKVSDPDGGSVRANFEVLQSGSVVWSGTTSAVTNGGTASMAVPSGKLVHGSTYSVRAKGNDNTAISKSWSPSATVTVDTSKPTTTIRSTAFVNGQWRDDVPESNTFTFDGPTDTVSFAYSIDGVAKTPKGVDQNGDATLVWLPKSGSHTVSVTATDKAGNQAASTFKFGVGPTDFKTPTADQRSTGVFPVNVSGRPDATGVTLSWRYATLQGEWLELTGVRTAAGGDWDGAVANDAEGMSSPGTLLWDATAQVDPATDQDPAKQTKIKAPALLELRACFSYSGTPAEVCSPARQVQLVPSAFDGNFPVTSVGPASVALFTGEMSLTEGDAVDSAAGLARTFSSFDPSTTTEGPFGRGWATSLLSSGDSAAELVDNRERDGSLVLVTAGGSSQMFVQEGAAAADGSVTFKPAGLDDESRIVLGGTTATLTRPREAVTSWERDVEGSWVLASTTATEEGGESEVDFGFSSPEYPTWIAQTAPGVSATCTETVQEAGCRGLQIAYTNGKVSSVQRVGHGLTPVTAATYVYNDAGLLATVCGTDPAGEAGPLCARYEYVELAGRTLLKTATPPGQEPWHFEYGATGRLVRVTRALDPATTTGTLPATWTITYDLDPATLGLPDLTQAAASEWGQATLAAKAAAVFDPSHVPSTSPTSDDLKHASLWYTDADGTTTNTAVYGAGSWLVDTTWYDDHGNVTQVLDGAGRERVLDAPVGDRPTVAAGASTITVYNEAGTRVEEELAPTHTATLRDGSSGSYRVHSEYVYDDESPELAVGRPPLPDGESAFDLVVETRRSAALPDGTGQFDLSVVRQEYAPVVAGDGDGWKLGMPTRVKTLLEDGSWSTSVTRYDTSGREIETRQPGGEAAADGSGSDAHATVTSYYAVDAVDPDCTTAGRPAWAGLVCKIGPAAQPEGPSMPVKHFVEYDSSLRPTMIVETSGATKRTVTSVYDDLGRPTSETVAIEGGDSRTSTISYDPASGLPVRVSAGGETVSTAYDTWGRVSRYTDGSGLESTTTYTSAGQVASRDDGMGTYTYGYDGEAEHRGLPTSIDVGLAGAADTFTVSYDAAGSASELTFPNGTVARYGYDEAGVATSLDYLSEGTSFLAFSATVDIDGRTVAAGSTGSKQAYTYDVLDRLTKVEDWRASECTTRTYGFRASSERTSFASFGPGAEGACQTATASVSKSYAYDAANRLRNAGYDYDALGRTLATPAGDTAPGGTGVLVASYHANDMVASLEQSVSDGQGGTTAKQALYGLDPLGRIDSITNRIDDGESDRMRYRFSDGSDSPSSIQSSADGGTTWTATRYIAVPGVGLAASVSGDGTVTYQLANLHGDVVASQAATTPPGTVDSYTEQDEYGNAIDAASPGRYGWLGSQQRSGDAVGGVMLMGARVYNPSTGSFLSNDAVLNGGANRFSYPADPVNVVDLTGTEYCRASYYGDCSPAWRTFHSISSTYRTEVSDFMNYYGSLATYSINAYFGIYAIYGNFTKYVISSTWVTNVQLRWVHVRGNLYKAHFRIKRRLSQQIKGLMRVYSWARPLLGRWEWIRAPRQYSSWEYTYYSYNPYGGGVPSWAY